MNQFRIKRLCRAVPAAAAVCALAYALLSTTPSELAAQPRETYRLALPVVIRPATDARKGMAGFVLQPDAATATAYAQMGISSSYRWQTIFTPTWNAGLTYPLPFQPINALRGIPGSDLVALGMRCAAKQLGCAAEAVRGQGAITVLYGNEPDGGDPNYSDALAPTEFARDWHEVRLALLASNPNTKFIVGNFLWPNGSYMGQFVSEYLRLFGNYPLGPNDRWGFHAYSNFGWLPGAPCNSPARYPQDAQCVSAAFGRVLSGIAQASAGRAYWITELGISGGAETAQADYAAMLPGMCRELRASSAEKFFIFIGVPDTLPNAWLVDESGSLTQVGRAYTEC